MHARCRQLISGTFVHHLVAEKVLSSPSVDGEAADKMFEGTSCTTYRYQE